MAEPARDLESSLGQLPPGVRGLDPAHLEHLAAALAEARRAQARELAAAGERGLRFVPRLLRGPVRKLVS
jgi:hypothetical protein